MKPEDCKHEHIALLRSKNFKLCVVCKKEIPWPLDEGQKPLLQPSRADRRSPK